MLAPRSSVLDRGTGERATVRPIRVAVRASYPAIHAGLVALIEAAGHVVVEEHVRDASDDEATSMLHQLDERADVIVSDGLPDADRADADGPPIVRLVEHAPPGGLKDAVPGALLRRDATMHELDLAVRAAAAGLRLADPRVAAGAEQTDSHADSALTPREVEVLRLLAVGMTNRGAALALGISEHTVKFHVGSVLSKLNARSRTEAVSIAARMGILPL